MAFQVGKSNLLEIAIWSHWLAFELIVLINNKLLSRMSPPAAGTGDKFYVNFMLGGVAGGISKVNDIRIYWTRSMFNVFPQEISNLNLIYRNNFKNYRKWAPWSHFWYCDFLFSVEFDMNHFSKNLKNKIRFFIRFIPGINNNIPWFNRDWIFSIDRSVSRWPPTVTCFLYLTSEYNARFRSKRSQ